MFHLVVTMLFACGGPDAPSPELVLDGPARVRVDQLGPVNAPRVVLTDGSVPELIVDIENAEVAELVEGTVVAAAPGETRVTAEHDGQQVTWTLVVDPAMVVRIHGAPGQVSVGDMLRLGAAATIGDEEVDPGTIQWSSSDPELLQIAADGSATALGSGTVWVTARSRSGAHSMVEIEVR